MREEIGLPVSSAWGFGTPDAAEAPVASNSLDLVMVGRSHLADPHWTYAAAKQLGVSQGIVDAAGSVRALAGALFGLSRA